MTVQNLDKKIKQTEINQNLYVPDILASDVYLSSQFPANSVASYAEGSLEAYVSLPPVTDSEKSLIKRRKR